MDKIGQVEIHISGIVEDEPLTPDNYDIRDLANILQSVEDMLFPNQKKNRPRITYDIQGGSVKHIFKTAMQYVISFNAILTQIKEAKSIDFLENKTAKVIENFQEIAIKNDYEICITTSVPKGVKLKINKETSYIRKDNIWTDTEFYFYGKILNAGGTNKTTLRIQTEKGVFNIKTPVSFFENLDKNIIHKGDFGIHAKGKQNINGEIDKESLKFIELIEYNTSYNPDYLQSLREKAQYWINDIDPDTWLKQIRKGYE